MKTPTPKAEPVQLCCPRCRHKFTPRPPRVRRFRVTSRPPTATAPEPVAAVDTSTLSTADLFDHFKKTAPLGDVRFMLAHARMSAGLRFAFEVLEASIVELKIRDRKTIYREYGMLQQMWRDESNRRQWAARYLDSLAGSWPVDRMLPAAPVDVLDEVAA